MGRKRATPAPFLAYGGTYLKSRQGRARGRPLTFAHTMHFVLRSSHARGDWSFRKPRNYDRVHGILRRFAAKHGVTIRKTAVHLNHLHLNAVRLSPSRHDIGPVIGNATFPHDTWIPS
jgi:hypothetical protein